MKDEDKTKKQLINKLMLMRRRVAELEKAESERKQAEEALQQSEVRYRNLVESSNDWVWEVDQNGVYTYASLHCRQLLGYEPEELIGKKPFNLMPPDEARRVEETFASIAAQRKPFRALVNTNRHKDGRLVILETNGVPVLDEEGNLRGYRGMDRDITERKRAEEALRKSEAQQTAILNGITTNIAFVDKDLRILWVNRAAAESVNELPEEMMGHTCHTFWADPAKPCENCPTVKAFQTKKSEHTIMHTPDGRVWDEGGEPVFDAEGNVIGVVEIAQDITERKRAEEALRESETKYRDIFENASEGIYQTTPDGRYLSVNPAFARMLGFTSAEEVIAEISDIGRQIYVHPEDRERLKILLAEKGRVDGSEAQLYRRDGQIIWISINARAVRDSNGSILYYEGTSEDITERKRAEEAVRIANNFLESIIEHAAEGLCVCHDVSTYPFVRFTVWNQRMQEITGYSMEQINSLGWYQTVYPDPEVQTRARERMARMRDGEDLLDEEWEITRSDGRKRILRITTTILRSLDGQTHVLALMDDITERKSAEDAVGRANAYNRSLIESSIDPLVTLGTDGKITDVNHATEALTGRSREELIGTDFSDYFTDPNEAKAGYQIVLSEGAVRNYELFVRHANGHVTPVLCNATLYRDESGKVIGVFGAARDITDRKRVEEELIKTQKLESLGIMAGGIAHDFNNLLGIILGNIYLAQISLEPENAAASFLREADKACSLATRLTTELITFATGGAPSKKIQSVRKLVTDAVAFALTGSEVKAELNIAEDLWPVDCDSGQIQQAIVNVIINAREAMLHGGSIEVSASNVYHENAEDLHLKRGKYLRLSIKDCGTGIPPDVLPRIFDPYFSTKERGTQKGMGLGLTIAYSIVRKHDGHIKVESQVGVGTTLHIYLPVSESSLLELSDKQESMLQRKGKVLVMDDEKMLREATGKMLEKLGYEVELAQDGTEAIALFRSAKEAGRPFDAVILDLTVRGGMGGKVAIEELLRVDPEIKAIVSTGYSKDPILSNFREFGFSGFITKPYRISELQEALDKASSGRGPNRF